MSFELTTDKLNEFKRAIEEGEIKGLAAMLLDLHPADIADIIEQLDSTDAALLLKEFEDPMIADILIELEEDIRGELLENYSGKEIAEDFVENLDSDDAADLIGELPEEKKREVLDNLEDVETAKQLASLLTHAEDTAGALMATELVKVNENWTVRHCVREMRKQAEEIEEVHAVYVIDDHEVLLGTLSLKKLLTTSTKTPVKEVYNQKVTSVKSTTPAEDVANLMERYDMVVVPVVDEMGRLLGRITIDDVVDVIKEEAERDYQLASGITDDVDSGSNLFQVTKARLPWLVIGLVGGLISASVISTQESRLADLPKLAFFIPLIAAMGGNVGVQSSAIVVQALANKNISSTLFQRLVKEVSVGLVNGLICSILLFSVTAFTGLEYQLAITISLSLFMVIMFASLFGTSIPLILDKWNIDPAVATGPFITTANDVFGLFIYFSIGKIVFGF